jgi:hypothetical protein
MYYRCFSTALKPLTAIKFEDVDSLSNVQILGHSEVKVLHEGNIASCSLIPLLFANSSSYTARRKDGCREHGINHAHHPAS